jgi:hypothetical protein
LFGFQSASFARPFFGDQIDGVVASMSVLPLQYHILDFLKWLPQTRVKNIMAAITKDIYIETTRVCYSRVITYDNAKDAHDLLKEIGCVTTRERERESLFSFAIVPAFKCFSLICANFGFVLFFAFC